jgi:ERCC4-type nuclease
MPEEPIVILQDDREKVRTWDQEFLGDAFAVKRTRLHTGDYTFERYSDLVCIERKANWEEIATNICKKDGRRRLQHEFQRMEAYPLRFLIVESSITQIPFTKFYSAYMGPQNLREWIYKATLEHGVQMFCIGRDAKHSQVFMREFLTALYTQITCHKLSRGVKNEIMLRKKENG